MFTIRHATSHDSAALARLAALDSSRPPGAPALIAEVSGEPVAALSLRDGVLVADPFRRTAAVADVLRLTARELSDAAQAGRTNPASSVPSSIVPSPSVTAGSPAA